MKNDLQLFTYTFLDNKAKKTLFLFHGTGGTNMDFMRLNIPLRDQFNLVGIQGNINENGMIRFFKRSAEGIFDQENIKEETEKLHSFLTAFQTEHQILSKQCYFLGYSNGANMLLATLFYYPDLLDNLALLHPMLPFTPNLTNLDLSSKRIFLSHGTKDQLVTTAQQQQLNTLLESASRNTEINDYKTGHTITREEIYDAVEFLKR